MISQLGHRQKGTKTSIESRVRKRTPPTRRVKPRPWGRESGKSHHSRNPPESRMRFHFWYRVTLLFSPQCGQSHLPRCTIVLRYGQAAIGAKARTRTEARRTRAAARIRIEELLGPKESFFSTMNASSEVYPTPMDLDGGSEFPEHLNACTHSASFRRVRPLSSVANEKARRFLRSAGSFPTLSGALKSLGTCHALHGAGSCRNALLRGNQADGPHPD